MNQSQLKLTLAFVSIFALSPIPFTNCARNPQSAAVPSTAFVSEGERLSSLAKEFQGKTSAQFCKLESSYGCMKRVYSKNIENENRGSELSCVGQFCVQTQVFHFNSTEAQEHCNGCTENLESAEYDCHLKLANQDGIYPIIVTSQSLSEGLDQLSDFCLSASGSGE
jgi:hypothetical protein